MAFNISFFATSVVQKMYEDKGIYNHTNKAFNGFIEKGADSVRIPKASALSIISLGTDPDADAGTDVKDGTSELTVATVTKMVRLKETVVSRFNNTRSGLNLFNHYVGDAQRKLKREYNKLVIEEAFGTANKTQFIGNVLELDDFIEMKEHFDNNEIPEDGRVMVLDSGLQKQAWAIDMLQKAAAYNIENLKKGVFVEAFGFTVFVSSLNPEFNGKKSIVSWYEPGNAFLLCGETTVKSVYVPKLGSDIHDIITYSAYKRLGDEFAYVKYAR